MPGQARSISQSSGLGFEGALITLSPFPVMACFMGGQSLGGWRAAASLTGAFCFLACAFIMRRLPLTGKAFGAAGGLASLCAAFPWISSNPFAGLTGSVIFIAAAFAFADLKIDLTSGVKMNPGVQRLERARCSAASSLFMAALYYVAVRGRPMGGVLAVGVSFAAAQVFFLHWAYFSGLRRLVFIPLAGLAGIGALLACSAFHGIPAIAAAVTCLSIMQISIAKTPFEKNEPWWEMLVNHPARMLLSTFFALCAFGVALLMIPASTRAGAIDVVDAVFTSVSAVCVTGLIVLDTPNDFTIFGQFCILLLIQLGGLGIMSIAAVALHAMGRRLSLKQERILTSMTEPGRKNLISSLMLILKFTFAVEAIGAVVLTFSFYSAGDPLGQALWRGVFTSISAFCNAGFALQSDSLMQYQSDWVILNAVSLLIILGGMAPGACLIIPGWAAGKPVPVAARIALSTTAVLLISGTVFIAAFEWEGILKGMTIGDKMLNAWFQSVTLRTAGFNSVGLAGIASPTYLIMIAFMLVGGSPGGTAGGVKTTTIGVLALTFWANISNRTEVAVKNRRIPPGIIFRAVTIVFSFGAVWFIVLLMLEITQQVWARDLIFEATSAIGTVGLSTGATQMLDEIGKILIILAMFAGRVGPATLFMLLSNDSAPSGPQRLDASISIT